MCIYIYIHDIHIDYVLIFVGCSVLTSTKTKPVVLGCSRWLITSEWCWKDLTPAFEGCLDFPPFSPYFFPGFSQVFSIFFPAKRQRQWLNKGNWWISDWFPDDFPKFESCWKIFHEMLEPWSHFHEHFMADGWIAGSLLDQVLALTRHKMQSKAAMQARSPRSFASSLSPCFIKVDLFIRGYSIYLLIHLST